MSGGDDKAQNQQSQSWGNLNQLFNIATARSAPLQQTGTDLQTKGVGELDEGAKYWHDLLTGDRTKVAEAAAPVANAATNASDATKREEAAMGTGRTGGTVAHNAEENDRVRQQVDTSIAGVAPAAATNLGVSGSTTAGIGAQDIEAALQALGISTNAAGTSGSQATQANIAAQQANAALWSSIIKGGADLATGGVLAYGAHH
jgi:hypothetical protein